MKIVLLSTLYPYRGGIAQFNACLLRELEKKSNEVVGVNFSRQYPSLLFPGKTQYVNENDPADQIPSVRLLDSINPFSWWNTIKFIKAQKPDLVVVRYWTPFLAPALGFICGKLKRSGIRVVAITDNIIPHEPRWWDRVMARYFLQGVNGFVAMTSDVERNTKDIISELPSIVKPHPFYNHFGARIDRLVACKSLDIPSGRKVLLFFGLIREYKGLDILLEAFSQLDKNYHLIIAGEAYGDFKPYQLAIDSSPLKDNITCINRYVGDHEVPTLFSAADIVVLPYRSATQSGITAVAFHFGLPVIATNVGGLAETISDGVTGLIALKPDSNLILQKIHQFFALRRTIHFEENIKRTVELHSWSGFVEALLKFSKGL
ncbi:MAG: glycosyltransferase [Flavobacteriales bacterium]|nr:glycosyltransferase [Flavobacteriales bacterium]